MNELKGWIEIAIYIHRHILTDSVRLKKTDLECVHEYVLILLYEVLNSVDV